MIGMFLAGIFVLYNYQSEKRSLSKEAFGNLIMTAENKAERINKYLSIMEEDIGGLQNSSEVKEMLKQDLIFDEEIIKKSVDEKTEALTREINNFLKIHPEMKIKELRENREFRDILFQPISKSGYTSVVDYENQVIVIHKFDKFVGQKTDTKMYQEEFPELYALSQESKVNPDISGFYDWKDPDGTIRRKYIRLLRIDYRTTDGVAFIISPNAYVDDYKTIRADSEYLENFKEQRGYHNLVLISPEGYLVYAVDTEEELGTNLEWEINSNTGFSGNYYEVKEKT